jgi:hypothetical protein
LRWRFEGVLSPEDAEDLASVPKYLDFSHETVGPLVDLVYGVADICTGAPSYCRVECRKEGHPWHIDTGTSGHMAWCSVSASVLLTPPDAFDGGGFYFADAPDAPIFHYLDLLIYDDAAENRHCVARNSGGRSVLLMFFGRENV